MTDVPGGAVAAVEDDDMRLADITADEGAWDFASRVMGGPPELSIVCGHSPNGEAALPTHQALQECGQTTMMTAGAKPNRQTVNLAARRAGRPPGTAHPAQAEPHQSTPSPTDNREPKAKRSSVSSRTRSQ